MWCGGGCRNERFWCVCVLITFFILLGHRKSSLGCGVANDFYLTIAQSADSLLTNPLTQLNGQMQDIVRQGTCVLPLQGPQRTQCLGGCCPATTRFICRKLLIPGTCYLSLHLYIILNSLFYHANSRKEFTGFWPQSSCYSK